jgi:Holliday junction resolvase
MPDASKTIGELIKDQMKRINAFPYRVGTNPLIKWQMPTQEIDMIRSLRMLSEHNQVNNSMSHLQATQAPQELTSPVFV